MMARNLKVLKLSVAVELSLDQISLILKHRPTLAHLQVDYVKAPNVLTDWKIDLPNLQILNLSVSKDVSNSGASALECLNCVSTCYSHVATGGLLTILDGLDIQSAKYQRASLIQI
jgi:hypothetical protein